MKCNKIAYENKNLALKDLKVIKADIKRHKKIAAKVKSNSKLRPYFCHWCGNWHLTTMSKGEARIQKEKQRKISIIKDISMNNTLSYLLSVSENWMTLDANEMKVRFSGVGNRASVTILNK